SVPQTPSAIASTSNAPSEAGGSGTSHSSMEFGLGGRTVMARKENPGKSAARELTRIPPKSSRMGLCLPERQIVPVHHLCPPLDAENEQNVARSFPPNFLRVFGIVGDKSPAYLVGIGPAHDHGIAPRECALDLDDANG